jgi:hypothetical protein
VAAAAASGFPRALLGEPAATRLAYFAAKVVAHPRLKEVHQALLAALWHPAGAAGTALVLVVGPTGVGKTTLRRRVEQQLVQAALPEMARNPGHVPVVAVEAVAPESGQFNWKDYYTRALLALDEPLIAHKRTRAVGDPHPLGAPVLGAPGMHLPSAPVTSGILPVKPGSPAPELRRALEQCLRERRVGVCLVDEAQHLGRLASGRRLLDQMDTLKSLAALTGTVHVLVGTYELLRLAHLSAQLSRRSVEIHFGRYRADRAADVVAFKSVLLTFQRHLPLAEEPDLVGRWETLYERSVGCVGVLKDWLHRTLAAALEADPHAGTFTWPLLERHAASSRQLLSLARELQEGEATLAEDSRNRVELRHLLGFGGGGRVPDARHTTSSPPTLAGAAGVAPVARVAERRPPGRVGQRRAARDPVGVLGARRAE